MQQDAWLRTSLAGGVCILLGVGLARFAYTPLIPALADSGWFRIDQANYLGAINLLGYLLGAAFAHRITSRFGARRTLGANLIVTVLSFYACMLDWGFLWYGIWRLACGVTGAILMVAGTSQALAAVPRARRPAATALIFSGVGLGIAASGTAVPWLISHGVATTWAALGALAMLLALWAWRSVWRHLPAQPAKAGSSGAAAATPDPHWPVAGMLLVLLAYGLDAVGYVPHTLFWVDFITHELNRGLGTGSAYWTAFGLGALAGPFVAGLLAQWLGFRPALSIALLVKAAAVALPVVADTSIALLLSSIVVGLLIPGGVVLVSGSLMELVPQRRQQQAWGWATLAFALLQALGAYGMSWTHTGLSSYRPLFAAAALALLAGAVCAGLAARRPALHET